MRSTSRRSVNTCICAPGRVTSIRPTRVCALYWVMTGNNDWSWIRSKSSRHCDCASSTWWSGRSRWVRHAGPHALRQMIESVWVDERRTQLGIGRTDVTHMVPNTTVGGLAQSGGTSAQKVIQSTCIFVLVRLLQPSSMSSLDCNAGGRCTAPKSKRSSEGTRRRSDFTL